MHRRHSYSNQVNWNQFTSQQNTLSGMRTIFIRTAYCNFHNIQIWTLTLFQILISRSSEYPDTVPVLPGSRWRCQTRGWWPAGSSGWGGSVGRRLLSGLGPCHSWWPTDGTGQWWLPQIQFLLETYRYRYIDDSTTFMILFGQFLFYF